ncbi:hypothetical protein EV179_001956 [Coemansia sp. RSA 487]|nr:hypothetical protein EV179_001956 [Coemansia sp. RSA 487]
MIGLRLTAGLLIALAAPFFVAAEDTMPVEQQRYRDKYHSQSCIMYEVRPGDYCYKIAISNGITYQQFLNQNPGIDCTNLQVGQSVCLIPLSPPSWGSGWGDNDDYNNEYGYDIFPGAKSSHLNCNSYTVKEGDMCVSIAAQNNVPVGKLMEANRHLPSWKEASKVHIDRDKLAGFGLGEEALHALIEEDKQIIDHDVASSRLLCGRLVPFELVASWNACEGYEGISRTGDYSKALDPHPLSENEKIILYFHGGSYLLGGPYSHREHIGEMCKATKMRTFSIDYRLAPLNPFPAQLHDALISFNYMLDLGFKPSNIILAGDSAGGHLSLDLFLLLRHGFLPKGTNVRGIILLSPMPGLSLKGKSLQYNRDFDYLTPIPTEWPTSPIRLLYRPGQKYTPGYLSELESPILTPANGSMADMPPTLIQCGTCEILVDDVRRLRDKIKEDNPDMGDQIIYEEYPDMFHVFHRLLYREESKQAFEQITAFVNSLK